LFVSTNVKKLPAVGVALLIVLADKDVVEDAA